MQKCRASVKFYFTCDDQEKHSYEKLQEFKLEVLDQLSSLEGRDEKIELYLGLQELLFEFHPIQF